MRLALLALVVLLPGAAAQAERGLVLEAHDQGPATSRGERAMWFEVGGERNPVLRLEPGAPYRVLVMNEGRVNHTLRFGEPLDLETPAVPPGGTALVRFRAPETAEAGEYWCELHEVLGMGGAFAVGDATPPAGNRFTMQRSDLVPGFEMVFAALAFVALVAWRRRR